MWARKRENVWTARNGGERETHTQRKEDEKNEKNRKGAVNWIRIEIGF